VSYQYTNFADLTVGTKVTPSVAKLAIFIEKRLRNLFFSVVISMLNGQTCFVVVDPINIKVSRRFFLCSSSCVVRVVWEVPEFNEINACGS